MSIENDLLLSMLFDEQTGSELKNIKFFEGSGRPDGATLRAAACAAISQSQIGGVAVNQPPVINCIQRSVEDFLAEIQGRVA